MVLSFCCYEGSGQKVNPSCSKDSKEERVWRAFIIFMLPGKNGPGRIGCHPHWVKICGNHNGQINLRAKQKYEVLSASTLYDFYVIVINDGMYLVDRKNELTLMKT